MPNSAAHFVVKPRSASEQRSRLMGASHVRRSFMSASCTANGNLALLGACPDSRRSPAGQPITGGSGRLDRRLRQLGAKNVCPPGRKAVVMASGRPVTSSCLGAGCNVFCRRQRFAVAPVMSGSPCRAAGRPRDQDKSSQRQGHYGPARSRYGRVTSAPVRALLTSWQQCLLGRVPTRYARPTFGRKVATATSRHVAPVSKSPGEGGCC